MNLLWVRPGGVAPVQEPDERRIREFCDSPAGVSESAASLASKLGISQRSCRSILEHLVEQGVVGRHDYLGIEPMYFRFPTR